MPWIATIMEKGGWLREGKLIVLLCLLLVAAISDIRTGKIGNRLILLGLILGGTITCYEKGISYMPLWMIQIFIPVVVFFLAFRIGGLGAGDIKLFSVIASFLTIKDVWICILASFAAGAAIGVAKCIYLRLRDHSPARGQTIHFSIPVLAGYLYYLGVMN